jgi:hypothetical protein
MRQALTGNHKEDFWDAMDKEIHSLETMDTWPMERKDLPVDSRVIPEHGSTGCASQMAA